MKLFLSGGGSGQDSIELDKKYIQSLNLAKPVLYIPIAINTEKYPYMECLKWIREQFQPLGLVDFVMWTEEDLRNKTAKDFNQFGGVYIGGGNTFKLLKELKEFGTFEILRKLASENIPIYGGSAGAIILAQTIIPALSADSNYTNVTDFAALNLLHDYNLWCHYDDSMAAEVDKYAQHYNLKQIIAIPEAAGLVIADKVIEVVGSAAVSVFSAGVKRGVNPGEVI